MAWTVLTFAFASKLTSLKMTQLQTNITSGAVSTYGNEVILSSGIWIVPEGMYFMWSNDNLATSLQLEIYDGASWNSVNIMQIEDNTGTRKKNGIQVRCDGTNFRVVNSAVSSLTVFYRKYG